MYFKVQYYKIYPLSLVVRFESVIVTFGNLCYAVTFCRGSHDSIHCLFSHLSSLIDFINSNFK